MPRRPHPRLLAVCCAAVATAAWVGTARAQESGIAVVVEQIAGSNVYLSAGVAAGIATGDTLQAYREGGEEYLGAFRVVAATETRAVVTFLDRPFAVTRGTTIRVHVSGNAAVAAAAAPVRSPAAPTLPSAPGPRLSGRLSLDFSGTQSTTKWLSNDEVRVERTFATPSMGLRLSATNLPGGLRFETTARATYRYSDPDIVQPDYAVQVYELSLDKAFRRFPFQFRLGRFYNPYESFSGYFDGALVRFGGRGIGVGAAAGLQPDRANGLPSGELPKFTGFLDYAVRGRGVRYAGDISIHQVRPRDGLPNHTFGGWSQYLRVGDARLSSDLQVDRDPDTDSWRVSRLHVSGALRIAGGLSLRGRYGLDRPYLIFRPTDVMPFRRDQVGGGLGLYGRRGGLDVEVTAHRFAEGSWSLAYGGSFNLFDTGILGLGVSGAGTYWTLTDGSTIQLEGGLSHAVGRGDVRVSYEFYRTESFSTTLLTHTAGLALTVPLASRVFASIRALIRQGDNLVANSLYASLWTSF